ncbi:MAG TPA: cupin [Nevskiaceae bacterium]
MSELRVYDEGQSGRPKRTLKDGAEITSCLSGYGVRFERWSAAHELPAQATQDEVIASYRAPIDRLMKQYGFRAVDVVSMAPDNAQKDTLRTKFLAEHTHSEHEVRFFVEGSGLFYLHAGDAVLGMLCTREDLISVPAGMTHWFDMGPQPHFRAIRLFEAPEGWVAHFTGSDIAERYPRYEPPHYANAPAA